MSEELSDVQPRRVESEGSMSDHPIYFGGGFGYGEQRNNGVLSFLQSQGYSTLPSLPDVPRGERDKRFTVTTDKGSVVLSRMRTLLQAGKMQPDQVISHYQVDRAQELIRLLDEGRQGKGVWALFQSADAINGLQAMHERPDLVDSAVLAYPAGIISQPNVLKAAADVIHSGWKGRQWTAKAEHDNFETTNGSKVRRELGASNFTVAASVALSDQTHLLSEIRSRPNPPGIWLVLGTEDWMIRAERVIESLRSPNDVDGILITDKPHGIKGRGDELTEWLKLFPLMEQAKKNRQAGIVETRSLSHPDRLRFFGDISEDKKNVFRNLAAAV